MPAVPAANLVAVERGALGRPYLSPGGERVSTAAQRERQRRLWRRRERLDCGHTDCRCHQHDSPTPQRVEGYVSAVEHLAANGCLAAAFTPELRAMWRRGGAERDLAESLQRRWSA